MKKKSVLSHMPGLALIASTNCPLSASTYATIAMYLCRTVESMVGRPLSVSAFCTAFFQYTGTCSGVCSSPHERKKKSGSFGSCALTTSMERSRKAWSWKQIGKGPGSDMQSLVRNPSAPLYSPLYSGDSKNMS